MGQVVDEASPATPISETKNSRRTSRSIENEGRPADILENRPDLMKAMDNIRMDKSAVSVVSLHDDSDEKEYWHSRTPRERMEALELMRQINYGYDPATARLQRVLEVAERAPG